MFEEQSLLLANAAYYDAYGSADLDALARLWAEDGLSCVHPGWPALFNRQDILVSYRELLSSRQHRASHRGRKLVREEKILLFGEEGRVICTEKIGPSTFVATNLFRSRGGDWRLFHHQSTSLVVALDDQRFMSTQVH